MNSLIVKNSIIKSFLELFVWDKRFRAKIKTKWVKSYLKKYVNLAITNTKITTSLSGKQEKIIWQYWHQGIENAPDLIKKCIESTKKYHPDFDIRVLSFETIRDYVKIPDKYYDLLINKKIPIAIFSDILRLYLLSTYGGTWVDSTLYFTDKIPDEVFNSDFLVMQKDPKKDPFNDKMSCYFIHSKKDSFWLHLIKNSIEYYWDDNDYLIHYFMFEHIVTMLSEANNQLAESWNNMKYYSTKEHESLRKNLYNDYSDELFKQFCKKSFMHKLSYKVLKDKSSGISFYDKLIENQL